MKFSNEQVQEILHRVELLISEHGWTKAEFYKRSGITSAQFSQWNTGTTKPKITSIGKMANALGVTSEFLIYGEQRKGLLAPFGDKDVGDVYHDIKEKLPDDPLDGLAEELQILMENPATRTLLFAGRHLSEDQINNFARIMQAMPEGENVANRKR